MTRIDALTVELARTTAERDVAQDALCWLVDALPERLESEFSPNSRRVLGALTNARAVRALLLAAGKDVE